MKKIYNKKGLPFTAIALVSLFALMSVLIYACTKPTDGINVLVDSQTLSPAPTTISFVNADSTSVNQPGDFNVTITGSGASKVQMVSGGTAFKVSHGMLSLSLVKGTVPTITNPVIFTVSAQVAGFAPFIQNVVITKDAPSLYVVKGLDYASSAAGTSFLKTTTALTGGTVVAATTLIIPKTTSLTENATITFAAGTILQDANKATINGVTLTSSIVQLGTSNNAATNAFPGGLFAFDALDKTGAPITGGVNFVPAGLVSINMTVGGTEVKNFSKPVNVTVELASMNNFATGTALKAGDILPYWSQNELTGQWKYEGDATVVLNNTTNKLNVVMPITHLSNWMAGWFWSATPTTGAAYGSCGNSLTVNLATADANFKGGIYAVFVSSAFGNPVAVQLGGDLHNGSSVTFKNLPNMTQAKVVVYYRGVTVLVSTLFATCSTSTFSVTVPSTATAFADPVNVSLDVTGVCSSKQVSVLPSAPFMLFQKAGATTFQQVGVVNVVNGKATTQLDNNNTYYLATYYNNTYYQTGNFTITKAPVTIPTTTDFKVTSTYDAATNTLNFTGTIPVPCN